MSFRNSLWSLSNRKDACPAKVCGAGAGSSRPVGMILSSACRTAERRTYRCRSFGPALPSLRDIAVIIGLRGADSGFSRGSLARLSRVLVGKEDGVHVLRPHLKHGLIAVLLPLRAAIFPDGSSGCARSLARISRANMIHALTINSIAQSTIRPRRGDKCRRRGAQIPHPMLSTFLLRWGGNQSRTATLIACRQR